MQILGPILRFRTVSKARKWLLEHLPVGWQMSDSRAWLCGKGERFSGAVIRLQAASLGSARVGYQQERNPAVTTGCWASLGESR